MDGRENRVSALAILNLEVKAVRRSQGGDARAAAAYRPGTQIGPYDYTRRLSAHGLTEKTRELDDQTTGPLEIEAMREAWALILDGHSFRLEHRATRRVSPPPLPTTRQDQKPRAQHKPQYPPHA